MVFRRRRRFTIFSAFFFLFINSVFSDVNHAKFGSRLSRDRAQEEKRYRFSIISLLPLSSWTQSELGLVSLTSVNETERGMAWNLACNHKATYHAFSLGSPF